MSRETETASDNKKCFSTWNKNTSLHSESSDLFPYIFQTKKKSSSVSFFLLYTFLYVRVCIF